MQHRLANSRKMPCNSSSHHSPLYATTCFHKANIFGSLKKVQTCSQCRGCSSFAARKWTQKSLAYKARNATVLFGRTCALANKVRSHNSLPKRGAHTCIDHLHGSLTHLQLPLTNPLVEMPLWQTGRPCKYLCQSTLKLPKLPARGMQHTFESAALLGSTHSHVSDQSIPDCRRNSLQKYDLGNMSKCQSSGYRILGCCRPALVDSSHGHNDEQDRDPCHLMQWVNPNHHRNPNQRTQKSFGLPKSSWEISIPEFCFKLPVWSVWVKQPSPVQGLELKNVQTSPLSFGLEQV